MHGRSAIAARAIILLTTACGSRSELSAGDPARDGSTDAMVRDIGAPTPDTIVPPHDAAFDADADADADASTPPPPDVATPRDAPGDTPVVPVCPTEYRAGVRVPVALSPALHSWRPTSAVTLADAVLVGVSNADPNEADGTRILAVRFGFDGAVLGEAALPAPALPDLAPHTLVASRVALLDYWTTPAQSYFTHLDPRGEPTGSSIAVPRPARPAGPFFADIAPSRDGGATILAIEARGDGTQQVGLTTLDASGAVVREERDLLAGALARGVQRALRPDGSFALGWLVQGGPGSFYRAWLGFFDAAGEPMGAPRALPLRFATPERATFLATDAGAAAVIAEYGRETDQRWHVVAHEVDRDVRPTRPPAELASYAEPPDTMLAAPVCGGLLAAWIHRETLRFAYVARDGSVHPGTEDLPVTRHWRPLLVPTPRGALLIVNIAVTAEPYAVPIEG